MPSYFESMSGIDPPPDSPEATVSKNDEDATTGAPSGYIADAVADVMKDQAEKAVIRDEIASKLDRPPSPISWLVLCALTVLSLLLWLTAPSSLAPPPPEPLPGAFLEAGLRMELYLGALDVEGYRRDQGRLPNSLAEAGRPFSEVEYERTGGRSYRLWIPGPEGIIQLASSDSLELFLGDAPEILRGGSR